jgi:hypothetical protein
MKLQNVFFIWFIITILLALEFLAIGLQSKYSVILYLQNHHNLWPGKKLTIETGKYFSVILGWIGVGLILGTNFYIIRKRVALLNGLGRLQNWFSVHLMCGLLGPTFIILHANFKVGGLVAISFWSMMIVAVSGVLGAYFYIQVLEQKTELNKEVQHWERVLRKMRDRYAPTVQDVQLVEVKQQALAFAGVFMAPEDIGIGSLPMILIRAGLSDFKLLFSDPPSLPGMPSKSRIVLSNYATATRKIYLIKPFQLMLGYWHTFHVPFTVVMYIAAAIHITVALLFQV